jgi:hypothetical protein
MNRAFAWLEPTPLAATSANHRPDLFWIGLFCCRVRYRREMAGFQKPAISAPNSHA